MGFKAIFSLCALLATTTAFSQSATIRPARMTECPATAESCADYDALVFVHGIYGADETFVNSTTNFNWPQQIPAEIGGRKVDVFLLNYRTQLLAWAKGATPDFDVLAKDVFTAMAPLRKREYRSIGFIAHSLGGNVVQTYILTVKTTYGHANRSVHAYDINIATPALGSQVADIGLRLKSALGMSDDLLRSLKKEDVYQRMLGQLQGQQDVKGITRACRPITIHLAYEKKALGPIKIVQEASALRIKERDDRKAQERLVDLREGYANSVKQCAAKNGVKPNNDHFGNECATLTAPTLAIARQQVRTLRSPLEVVADVTAEKAVGFDENHSSIVKPSGKEHLVYVWVQQTLEAEFRRLAEWDRNVGRGSGYLCGNDRYVAE